MNQPTAPVMQQVPQAYNPQTFGGAFNPWNPTSQDSGAGSQNPYASGIMSMEGQASSDAGNYTQQMPGMQQSLNQGMQGAQQFEQSTSAYPSYPNIAGAGSQQAGIPQINTPPMSGAGGKGAAGSNMQATDTSHGFNPWSLQGEAMTRAK